MFQLLLPVVLGSTQIRLQEGRSTVLGVLLVELATVSPGCVVRNRVVRVRSGRLAVALETICTCLKVQRQHVLRQIT
jgi:hypothetical protein